MGTLYIVATPIGNLEDVTLRALRVLGEVAVVAAEDTRLTRRLFARHDIATPLVSYHEHSGAGRERELLAHLSAGDVALVTDAGTPGISDPGARIVAAARAAGHLVVPVPGPSSVVAALSVAGIPADQFVFLGFLPRRQTDRRRLIGQLAAEPRTLVAFEAPHRVRPALADLAAGLGDRLCAVARELTKRYEEVWTGRLADAAVFWAEEDPRGEFTLVIEGAKNAEPEPWPDAAVLEALASLRSQGLGPRASARQLSPEAGRPAREIYSVWVQSRTQDEEEAGWE